MNEQKQLKVYNEVIRLASARVTLNARIGGTIVNWEDDNGRARCTIFTLVENADPDMIIVAAADKSPIFGTWGSCTFQVPTVQQAITKHLLNELLA